MCPLFQLAKADSLSENVRSVHPFKYMTFTPISSLPLSRQKALAALHAMRSRAESAMQSAQVDHGTQSCQFAQAAMRYEHATAMLTEQMQRTQMPEHPLYVSPESSSAYYEAIK